MTKDRSYFLETHAWRDVMPLPNKDGSENPGAWYVREDWANAEIERLEGQVLAIRKALWDRDEYERGSASACLEEIQKIVGTESPYTAQEHKHEWVSSDKPWELKCLHCTERLPLLEPQEKSTCEGADVLGSAPQCEPSGWRNWPR